MSIYATVKQQVTCIATQPTINALLSVTARLFMSFIFILAGYGKMTGYAATESYMASKGLPAGLLPLVIAVEFGGGLALLFGVQTRVVAALLAGFSLITGVIFHAGADQMQHIMLMKNIAMAGGLLAFVRTGAGKLSVDGE